MIKALIFDFDGVLVESVDIKTTAFCELFKSFPEYWCAIKEFHLKNGGLSRDEKIKYYYKQLLKRALSQRTLSDKAAQFRRLVINKVIEAPFVPGALELLETCVGRFSLFIASGTPQTELREIIHRRGMTLYFHGVFGSPQRKEVIFDKILKRNLLQPEEAIYLGDSETDLYAAKKKGLHFIARKKNEQQDPWLDDPYIIDTLPDLRRAYSRIELLNNRREHAENSNHGRRNGHRPRVHKKIFA